MKKGQNICIGLRLIISVIQGKLPKKVLEIKCSPHIITKNEFRDNSDF